MGTTLSIMLTMEGLTLIHIVSVKWFTLISNSMAVQATILMSPVMMGPIRTATSLLQVSQFTLDSMGHILLLTHIEMILTGVAGAMKTLLTIPSLSQKLWPKTTMLM
jgi:hypothetical protein